MNKVPCVPLAFVACLALCGCNDRSQPAATTPPPQAPVPIAAGNVTRTPAAVKDAFARYKAALQNQRGSEVAAAVDSATIHHFAEQHGLALNATREELQAKDAGTKMSVLVIRARATRADLEGQDGRAFLAYSVDQGWLKEDSSARLEISEPQLSGDTASANMIVGGMQTQLPVHFVAEDGTWRFKYSELVNMADGADRKRLQQSSTPEDERIIRSLEKALGRSLPDSIWDPMK